jgi:hypothetical protein
MAENKTKPTKVSVAAFIAAVPDAEKRADAKTLIQMMQDATGEKATMWGPSIIGFGNVHYKYESGREGDMPIVAFSPRKPALVCYGLTQFPGAEPLLAKLGKHSTGKGCLYLKRLSDVNVSVLGAMIKKSVASKIRG